MKYLYSEKYSLKIAYLWQVHSIIDVKYNSAFIFGSYDNVWFLLPHMLDLWEMILNHWCNDHWDTIFCITYVKLLAHLKLCQDFLC